MKKTISILLVLFALLALASCNAEKIEIDECEWKMSAVMSAGTEPANSVYEVIAVGAPDEIYPDAPIVDVVLSAADGKITLSDATNGKVYNGTYKKTKTTLKSTDYEIVIDGQIGYATVAPTEYYNGTEVPTLPISIGGYALYFIPNE